MRGGFACPRLHGARPKDPERLRRVSQVTRVKNAAAIGGLVAPIRLGEDATVQV
jgi:hypothetical protein